MASGSVVVADVVVEVVVDFEEVEILCRVAEGSRDVACLFGGRKADDRKAVGGFGLGSFGEYRYAGLVAGACAPVACDGEPEGKRLVDGDIGRGKGGA